MKDTLAINVSPSIFTQKIRVSGVVQGVGFRPFIYRLASVYGLSGWVLNDPEGVLIAVQGCLDKIEGFFAAIGVEPPILSKISKIEILEQTEHREQIYDNFDILESSIEGSKHAVVPSDSHVCEDCLCELLTESDRRYRYPFINCTNCGPRFSLIQHLPYDRKHTTMSSFDMCAACYSEYTDPDHRRYHAQPNACADCGPKVSLSGPDGVIGESDTAVLLAVNALLEGLVVAIKSVGGFHLAVNAQDGAAVERLRQRKKRDAKPFAIMVDSVASAGNYVECLAHEAQLLESAPRPIVLLKKKEGALPGRIAPNNPNLGVMLASAPLHYLLLNDTRMPVLIMTSGNVSGYPIAYQNNTALEQLFSVADYVLHHDRDIETRVDDSVMRCSTHNELDRPLVSFIRRSRGYAPYPLELKFPLKNIVAFGAELKTTVALANKEKVYISQHIGDLKNDETFRSHQECAEHLCQLYDLHPDWIACDMHPSFRSTRFAREKDSKKIIQVQHHHAHMASCMAENQLEGQTIGVIFDGAGFGLDNTIWGGEFLTGDYVSFKRAVHLRHIHLLGGDKAVHEPIRLALALAVESMGNTEVLYKKVPSLKCLDEQQRHVFTTMLMKKISAPPTSSMGRLFDGVAALLDICVKAEYEAQGPIEMEALLDRDMSLAAPYSFLFDYGSEPAQIDYRPLICDIVSDIENKRPSREISRRFHSTIVEIVTTVCRHLREITKIHQVVLSGGVFLNEFLLVNSMVGLRRNGFSVHCHHMVPTNDGGISLGQIMVANAQLSIQ
jgi:hydrogenase maturation protein HypF